MLGHETPAAKTNQTEQESLDLLEKINEERIKLK